jgi:hypothetical protein
VFRINCSRPRRFNACSKTESKEMTAYRRNRRTKRIFRVRMSDAQFDAYDRRMLSRKIRRIFFALPLIERTIITTVNSVVEKAVRNAFVVGSVIFVILSLVTLMIRQRRRIY